MDERDKLKLRGNFRYLVGQIRVSDIMDFLFERGILTDDDYQELEPGRRTERNNVRTLMQILFRRGPKAYDILCEALVEAGYDHVVKKLQDTDPNTVVPENADELDSFLNQESQLAEFQRRLWKQTEELELYKRDVDDMKKQLKSSEELKMRYAELEKGIQEKGFKEQYIIDQLQDYMSKAQQDDIDSGRSLTVPSQYLKKPPSPMLPRSGGKDQICRIAMELSCDVVAFMTSTPDDIPPEPNRYAKKMRSTVAKIIDTKASVFESFITKLSLTDTDGFNMLQNVADEMFRVGKNNWGRIVALYAFGGFVAKHATENKMTSISMYIGDYLGKYVAKNLSRWIEEKGGWVTIFKY